MNRRPASRHFRAVPTKADKRATAAVIVAHRKASNLPPLPVETLCHCYGLKREEAEALNNG